MLKIGQIFPIFFWKDFNAEKDSENQNFEMFEEVIHTFDKSDWFHVQIDQKILDGIYCLHLLKILQFYS